MWKSLFFLGNPGRKREKPLWNGCGGRVERKAAPCSFTHPRGNPAVECGKKWKEKRTEALVSTGLWNVESLSTGMCKISGPGYF